MGYYINPPDTSKEVWLCVYGIGISPSQLKDAEFGTWLSPPYEPMLPVCLVNNISQGFTAAGVCYSEHELEAFMRPDGRPKIWYLVPIKELLKVKALPRWPLRSPANPEL